MLTDHDSDWNIEDVTDTEICAAILYLEPNTGTRANWVKSPIKKTTVEGSASVYGLHC